MALVFIKSRQQPIEINTEKARGIKARWLGDSFNKIEKADIHDVLDLGEWAGEYGQIRSIDLYSKHPDEERESRQKKMEEEQREQRMKEDEFRKLPPEEKAKKMEFFKVTWSVRNGFKSEPIPQKVLDKVYQIQLKYYKNNPEALSVPMSEFILILPKNKSELLEDKKLSEEIPS